MAWRLRHCVYIAVVLLIAVALSYAAAGDNFSFAILGDRTGEAQPGVYEQVWSEAARLNPAFVITTGDSIEGLDDVAAQQQWQDVERIWKPHREIPLHLVPGNHDVWSASSEELYRKYAGHPLHYSFDYGPAHFTVLDNSRTEELPGAELAYLEQDLKAHAGAPLKLILSHRPSWLVNAALQNTNFPLQRLAHQYGVRYVIAGHVHQLLRFDVEGVTYLSVQSSGGHLRLSRAYEDGWFYGYISAEVKNKELRLQIHELAAPHGEGRVTKPEDWGMLGLVSKPKAAAAAK